MHSPRPSKKQDGIYDLHSPSMAELLRAFEFRIFEPMFASRKPLLDSLALRDCGLDGSLLSVAPLNSAAWQRQLDLFE